MPVFYCGKHGRAGAVFVCSHIKSNIELNEITPKVIIASYYSGNFLGFLEAPMIGKIGYCETCVEKHGFPSESVDLSTEKDFEAITSKEYFGVCVKCFNEAQSEVQ